MIAEKRRTRGSRWALLFLEVALAISTGSDPQPYYVAVAFTPSRLRTRTRTEGQHAHDLDGGTALTFRLHAFPSDQAQPRTAAAKAQLQNDHFASSQTTSSVSQDSSSSTTLAPPVMARPATESNGNDHKLARVEQQQPQQIE